MKTYSFYDVGSEDLLIAEFEVIVVMRNSESINP